MRRKPQHNPGPIYRIFHAGKDSHLTVHAPNAEAAIAKARRLFPSYMLGWPDPLTARLFRDKKGEPV